MVPWALCLWHANDYQSALQLLDREGQCLVATAEYWILRGMVLRKIPNRLDEALKSYKKALIKSPLRPDIYFNIGNIFRDDLDLHAQASRAYSLSLQLDPGAAKGWLNYAIALQEQDA